MTTNGSEAAGKLLFVERSGGKGWGAPLGRITHESYFLYLYTSITILCAFSQLRVTGERARHWQR